MRAAVIYFTKSGNTGRMAMEIVRGIESAGNAQARAFDTGNVDTEYVKSCQCVIFGTPTYYAAASAEAKLWLEQNGGKLGLKGKLTGAFATEDYIHGGGEAAIESILTHMMVLGAMAYSGGGSFGKPVIHLGPTAVKGRLKESDELFFLYGQRMALKACELFEEKGAEYEENHG